MTRKTDMPTPAAALDDTPVDAPAPTIDRNDCGFGPCPVTDCDWGNWGDLPVCRQHYVAHMDTVFLPEDDDPDTTNATPSDDVADTTLED